MASPLLATKLHAPRPRTGTVGRQRLLDRLAGGDRTALTLVSAPAGFGKTTLVADWLADHPAVAWVSLDRRDDDPARFWAYLAAAAAGVADGPGVAAVDEAPPEEVVTILLNALDAAAGDRGDVVVVLDDFHVIESPAIHDELAFFVDHLPHGARLVVTTRSDPPLPLATWRARGQLLELRAADLRFTGDEADAYLAGSMGLALEPAQVALLEARTEGWIAALQLAGLSLQGADDVAGFIEGFAGDDRFVVDYLVDEVLDRQGGDIRPFLLETSVLGTLTGPLCDAVTGRPGSQELLRRLDRANLFLVPLDDRRVAYRYHHLFADVLRARLLDEAPELVAELHRRACDWLAEHGEPGDAVDHALAGGHTARAAELIELAAPAMRRDRQEATLRRWLEALPPSLFERRPVLAVTFVGARMATGDPSGADTLLDLAEAALDPGEAAVVVDRDELATLPAQLAVYRAGLALLADDTSGTIQHASRVLELVEPDDHLRRGSASALLGLAHWRLGDLAAAAECYGASIDHLAAAGHHADVLGCSLALADIRMEQGRPTDASAILAAGLRTTERHPGIRGAADMHVGLAEVAIERADLAVAADHLRTAVDLGDPAGLPQNPYRRRVALARLAQAQGRIDDAVELLEEAGPLYDTDFSPRFRPVGALLARAHLAGGDLDSAERWVASSGIAEADLDYVRAYEHATYARVLLARHASGAGGDALAGAVALLERLVAEAEQRGQPTTELLALLDTAQPGFAPRRPTPGLVDDLSTRERDVLRLLRTDLSGPEIARELHVSLNTFRTHTKNIYAKLGATTRREAVRRAGELGL